MERIPKTVKKRRRVKVNQSDPLPVKQVPLSDQGKGASTKKERKPYGPPCEQLNLLASREFANGRRVAVEVLDCMLSQARNVQALYLDMQDLFDTSPSTFLQEFARPFMTKSSLAYCGQPKMAAVNEDEFIRATSNLRRAFDVAAEHGNAPAMVAATRELGLLLGLHRSDSSAVTVESLREDLSGMFDTIASSGRTRKEDKE